MTNDLPEPRVLHRGTTERGELVLRRVATPDGGHHFEIISNGVFLMDTRDGRSERALVRAALAATATTAADRAAAVDLLIGGLGVGFSLLEALATPTVGRVTVAEIEPDIVSWHSVGEGGHLAGITDGALDDPRVRVVPGDVLALLAGEPRTYDAICMDVDNGPGWTVTEQNRRLYDPSGVALLRSRLTPGGVLAVWSAHRDDGFEALLRRHFDTCRVLDIPTAPNLPADVIYLAHTAPAHAR